MYIFISIPNTFVSNSYSFDNKWINLCNIKIVQNYEGIRLTAKFILQKVLKIYTVNNNVYLTQQKFIKMIIIFKRTNKSSNTSKNQNVLI